MVQVTRQTSVLNGQNTSLLVPCSGTSSATIHIRGTANCTLTVSGGADTQSLVGERMLMQTGVGSLARDFLKISGAIDREFRIVTGSDFVVLSLSDYASGSLHVDVSCTEDASIVFINGPVHTADDQVGRAGRSFLASFGGVQVTAGQEFLFTLKNPSESKKNILLTERIFAALATEDLEYITYRNPSATLSTVYTPINRNTGSDNASTATAAYQVATAGAVTMGGILGSGEPIRRDGTVRERKFLVVLPPGTGIGYSIRGAGANLNNAARIYATWQWIEEETWA